MKRSRMARFLCVLLLACCLLAGCNKPKEEKLSVDSPQSSITPGTPEISDIPKENPPVLLEFTKKGITFTVDSSTGLLTKVSSGTVSLELDGIYVDAGYQEEYQFQQLGYKSFDTASTWELPMIWARKKELPEQITTKITETELGFTTAMTLGSFTVTSRYEAMEEGTFKVDAVLTITEKEAQLVNGVGFLIKGLKGFDKATTTFEFPGSTPGGVMDCANYNKYSVTVSDYASPVLQFRNGERFQNLLFVNEQEKWSTGVFCNENDLPCAVFLSAVEGYLKAGEELIVGTLYFPLTPQEEDPYLSVQEFWTALGYHTPENSVNDGPVYSCHPYGTMDTNYFNRLTLQEYAEQLDAIAAMGFKNVWLLPIFYHTGDNVYEPIDQGVIDERYGGEEGAKQYIRRAHELGLRVLFDLVPHGPRPVYEFAKKHGDWVSKNKEGENQIEWECVSFDYNNPGYYNYTVDLLSHYAKDFGLDGARIDCAMGGLSNWQPVDGLRPSSSGLLGGVSITKAVKEGFLKGGVTPLLLPENFHPIPYYAEYTDLFYDMPLFRMINSLNHLDITETEYVRRLSHWLHAERSTSVKGHVKLRFLGNHDTVTWTFDAERAQTFYGTEKAKALWCILSLIDGVPFIYQGDEDPAAYHLEGENLTEFFTELLSARNTFLPPDYEIEYLDTGSPVFAFRRYAADGSDEKLILVNLSAVENSYPCPWQEGLDHVRYLCGSYELTEEGIKLAPYTCVMLEIK